MPSLKKTALLTAAALLYLVVIIAFLGNPKPDIYNTLARLFALLGIVTLYLAAMSSIFGRWISAVFGTQQKKRAERKESGENSTRPAYTDPPRPNKLYDWQRA